MSFVKTTTVNMQPFTVFIATMCCGEVDEVYQRRFLIRKEGNAQALEEIRKTCRTYGLRGYKVPIGYKIPETCSSSLIEFLLLKLRLADDGTEDWGRILDEEYDNDGHILIDEVLTLEIVNY